MPNNSIISKNKMLVKKNKSKKKNNKKFKTIKKKGGENSNFMKKKKNSVIKKNKSKKVNRIGLKLKIGGSERYDKQGPYKKQKTVSKFAHGFKPTPNSKAQRPLRRRPAMSANSWHQNTQAAADAAVSAVNATGLAGRKRNSRNSNLHEPPPKERMTVRNEYNNKFLSKLDIIITDLSNLKKLNLHNEKQEALSQFEGLGLHICQIIDWLRRERKQGEDESTPWEQGMNFNSNSNSEEKDEEEEEGEYISPHSMNSNSNSNLYSNSEEEDKSIPTHSMNLNSNPTPKYAEVDL